MNARARTALLLVCLLLAAAACAASAAPRCPAVAACLSARAAGAPCGLLPVPPQAVVAPPGPRGYNLTRLRPGVFAYADATYVTLILAARARLALVDFPPGAAALEQAVLEALAGAVPRRLDMVYSHRHVDHIAGAADFRRFARRAFPGIRIFVWGTAEARAFLANAKGNAVPLPDVIVGRRGRTVNVAPRLALNLRILGGHTPSDLVAHVPPSLDGPGVAHYVDVVTPGSAPFLDFGLTVDFRRYIAAQRNLLKLDFNVLSAGHGRLGTPLDVLRNIRYTKSVLRAALESADQLPPDELQNIAALVADPTAVQFANDAWAFSRIIELRVDICVQKLIERWGCVLAAVDIWGPSHCKVAGFFGLVDNQ